MTNFPEEALYFSQCFCFFFKLAYSFMLKFEYYIIHSMGNSVKFNLTDKHNNTISIRNTP